MSSNDTSPPPGTFPAPTSPPPSNDTSPPPPPATPEAPLTPPPPPSTRKVPSPSPPPGTVPLLPPPAGLAKGTLIGLIVGIGIGAITVLVAVGVFVILRRRKRRRMKRDQDGLVMTSSGGPPKGPKDDPYTRPPQHWQQHTPPPTNNVVTMVPKPAPPWGIASNPQLSAVHVPTLPALPSSNSSLNSGKPHHSLSPGMSFGFSKSTFTYEELAMATDGFTSSNLLGQGGFGYVHKGILPNGREVAIKQLKVGSGQGEREFQAEVEIISRIHHRHLVSLVGYCMSGNQRMLVYEFVANNTLEFHLHGKGVPTMTWETRMRIALGSAKGLAYLHEDCQPKVIHRDIKASNILLDCSFEAKVADFGLAKFSPDADTHVSTRVMGTFGYIAPEYASSGKLTDKSDVFSFGVMLLELITGRRPVDRTQSSADDSMIEWATPLLTKALEDGNFDTIADPMLQKDYDSSEMGRMVACAAVCVRYSARRRPRMSQIVRALEGNISLDNLNEGIIPGQSTVYSSYGSSDYDTSQFNEDMKKFRKIALETQEHSISEHSGPTSEYSLHPSGTNSERQQTYQV